MENVNKLGVTGPGGVRCRCCAPQRGQVRAARARANLFAIAEGLAALEALSEPEPEWEAPEPLSPKAEDMATAWEDKRESEARRLARRERDMAEMWEDLTACACCGKIVLH